MGAYVHMFCGCAFATHVGSITGTPLSSCEAEMAEQAAALARGVVYRTALAEIDLPQDARSDIWGDNSSTLDMAKDAKSSASARHFQRYTDFCKDVCDEEDGVYAPKHVRTDVNPVDFMGKVVTAQKYFISTQYLMNLKAMVPFEDS